MGEQLALFEMDDQGGVALPPSGGRTDVWIAVPCRSGVSRVGALGGTDGAFGGALLSGPQGIDADGWVVAVMYDEIVVRVQDAQAELVERATLPELHLEERNHLQEWVLAHPAILGDGVAIITAEYDKWQSADGNPVADRLDLLGIDPDGRLVVAELKRAEAPHTVHMQAINYAAMVSRLQPRDVAELYSAYRPGGQQRPDVDSALTWLESEKLLTPETIKHPRIVLIASHFPASVTASVVWLNEQGVSISLVRFRPYRLASGETIVSFSRLYPVPDVEEFTIGRRADNATGQVIDDGPPWDEPRCADSPTKATPQPSPCSTYAPPKRPTP